MVPLFLLILIEYVFSAYQTIYSLNYEAVPIIAELSWGLMIFLKTVPIAKAITCSSKITATGRKMDNFIGKLINTCDDDEVFKRVNNI